MKVITLILTIFLVACSPRAIREAKQTVAQADSLWRAGTPCNDSASLAQAYQTLATIPLPFREGMGLGSSYARSCYHYGRLLRAKEDPVSAMQVFINATHSHTRDYHILGRVYSNMGDIAHLAGEFELSYDMFERSAGMYLKNKDSLLYCYCLNSMAFELAEQGKKKECLNLLTDIEEQCADVDVRSLVVETKADAYLYAAQYDSAIYYADQSIILGNTVPTCHIIKAQAFSRLEITDSALFYAKIVLDNSYASYQDRFNALFVVSHFDSTLCAEDIRTLDSQREDIRYYEHEPNKEKLTDAIYLLNQDLHRKPDWRWLYVVCALVLFVCASSILYDIWRKRKQHRQIIQEVQEKEVELDNLSKIQEMQHNQIIKDIEETSRLIAESQDIRTELAWKNFNQMCAIINRRFYSLADRLQGYSLSQKEMRLCILVLLQASTKQMVDLIPYSQSGIGKFKNLTAQKIGTTTKQMRSYIINLIS